MVGRECAGLVAGSADDVAQDDAGRYHGYVWERGRFRSIEAGGATGINNRGQIVGVARIVRFQQNRGFLLRDGAGGRFTPIDVPGARGTAATGINDAGTIVGLYDNFDATPSPPPTDTAPMGTMP